MKGGETMTFLQTAANLDGALGKALAGGLLGGLLAFIAAFLVLVILIGIAIYIYTSFAFMKIAEKAKIKEKGIAWIPIVGKPLLASKIAKMHWWPILLLIGAGIPFVGWICGIAFAVFFVIWMWKTFETLKKPGWWAIFYIIPVLNIVWLIFIGIAAWGKTGK